MDGHFTFRRFAFFAWAFAMGFAACYVVMPDKAIKRNETPYENQARRVQTVCNEIMGNSDAWDNDDPVVQSCAVIIERGKQ